MKPYTMLSLVPATLTAGLMVYSGSVNGHAKEFSISRLAVAGSSGGQEVARRVCFMYTDNAKRQKWFDISLQ